MRRIDSSLKAKIEKAQQTLYEKANPSMIIWISRHRIPLENNLFLEKCKIAEAVNPSNVSIAARRPKLGRQADRIYAAFIENGKGKIYYAEHVTDIKKFNWNLIDTITGASDVAICFDANMIKTIRGKVEIVTKGDPWVFWVNAGALKAKVLGGDEEVLVNSNVTAISAIRGTKADVSDFDQGLMVFYIQNGAIYYRSLIKGEWENAVSVTLGPSGVTWVDITAGRTWDYRVVLQCKDSTGKIYELFTRSEIAGLANIERIEIDEIKADGKMVDINYIDTKSEDEHIEIAAISAAGGIIYGLSPVPVKVENIDDGEGDWGKYIIVEFDYPITGITGQAGQFILTDGNEATYTAQTIAYVGEDNRVIKLGFVDFNGAYGTVCNLSYTPGAIEGPAVDMSGFDFEFTPSNLVANDPAVPVSAENIDNKNIIITFDSAVSSPDFSVLKTAFTVTGQEYDMVPGGTLQNVIYIVDSVAQGSTNKELKITLTAAGRMKYPQGDVYVNYDSSTGKMMSPGGAVSSFIIDFEPKNIIPIVFNPNDLEKIEITNITATGTLKKMNFLDAKSADEKIEITSISAAGQLVHIDDIEV